MSVRVEVGGGVLRVVLDRPDARNAITPGMRAVLADAAARARSDPEVRALLLTGAGSAFCAGMDLGASAVRDAGQPGFDPRTVSEALRTGLHGVVRGLWELDKPTVAAVHGPAVGPGAHLALACDFVLVCPAARFLWSFHRIGLVADVGGAYLLPRLVGMARAKALLLLGEEVSGEDAVAAGLAHRCLDDERALAEEAQALALRLATGPTRSLGLTKRLLNRSFESDLDDSLDLEAHLQALATTSEDLVEGLAAFRDKRPPEFHGR